MKVNKEINLYGYGLLYALVLVTLYYKFNLTLDFIKFAVLTLFLIFLSIKDIETKTISNKILLILAITGFVFLLLTRNAGYIVDCLVTALVVLVFMSFISFLSKGSFGMGDVKLLSVIAIYMGSIGIFNTLFLSILFAGLYSVGLLVIKKADRKSTIPFAPFVALGLFLTIVAS